MAGLFNACPQLGKHGGLFPPAGVRSILLVHHEDTPARLGEIIAGSRWLVQDWANIREHGEAFRRERRQRNEIPALDVARMISGGWADQRVNCRHPLSGGRWPCARGRP